MKSIEPLKQKWYKNPATCLLFLIVLVIIITIIISIVLLSKNLSEKNSRTHIHYTRLITNLNSSDYELYQLNILQKRNPKQQYKLLADFLRKSLVNRTTYEQIIPSCPIMFAMTTIDHPEDWHAMLFGTKNYPKITMPYPYVCYLSVLPNARRHKLGSILLNQFINYITEKTHSPPVTHIQLHTNWENCRAQRLYNRCGFRCNQFTPNGYSKPFESNYTFGHMIRMELNIANIKDIRNICHNIDAVNITAQDELHYKQLCENAIPMGINRTCN